MAHTGLSWGSKKVVGRDLAQRDRLMSPDRPDAKVRQQRLIFVSAVAATWVVVLIGRLYSLQVASPDEWQRHALKQHAGEMRTLSERGAIKDREGRLLAVSVPAGSVFAHPKRIPNKTDAAETLAKHLQLEPKAVLDKLNSGAPFVWIARQTPRTLAEQVRQLGVPGVDFFLETKRMYPYNRAASTLIGRVGLDGKGLSGLEMVYNRYLEAPESKTSIRRDALGKQISFSAEQQSFELPQASEITLTIDAVLQLIVDEELERGRLDAKAKHGLALMVDAESGEVLAMSHAPTLNLNDGKVSSPAALKNLVTEAVFEPGSIFKPIVAAIGIELGKVKPEEIIHCENGRFVFGKRLIKDVHGQGAISFSDVVVRSSNIGMAKVGARIGSERLYESLKAFGFGQSSGLNLPGQSNGILRHVSQWAEVDIATHSFGQGVAVTPAQLVRSVAAIVNGGVIKPLRLALEGPEQLVGEADQGVRLISEQTASAVQQMMVQVVEDPRGTGKKAAIPGILVGGKTGTAQKAREDGRGYAAGKYVASFVGFVDGRPVGINRRIVLLVSIDEPSGGVIYGGALAAPVFQRVMERTVNYLGQRFEPNSQPKSRFEADVELELARPAQVEPNTSNTGNVETLKARAQDKFVVLDSKNSPV